MGIALGLLGGLFLGGAVYLSPARLAKTIDRDLRARLGPVEHLQVYVRGPRGVPVMKGRFDSVDIKVRGFNGDRADLPTFEADSSAHSKEMGFIKAIHIDARDFLYDQVRVQQAQVQLTNLRFDAGAAAKKQMRLLELEAGEAEIRLTEAELRARALPNLSGVLAPTFEFERARLKVTGKHKVGLLSVPFSLSGQVAMRNGTEVHLVETDLRLSVVPVPDGLEQRLLSNLNPVYTFKTAGQWPFRVAIESVQLHQRELVAKCKVTLQAPQVVPTGVP